MPQTMEYVTEDYTKWATTEDGQMIGDPALRVFPDDWAYLSARIGSKLRHEHAEDGDELFAYAKAVTEQDPDRNGKADTWLMGAAGAGQRWVDDGRADDDVRPPSWNVKDGKLNHPMLDGTTEGFLEYVKKLYDNKLLAPDWYTISGSRSRRIPSRSNRHGLYPGWNLVQEQYDNAKKKDPAAAALEPLDPLKSNDGKGGMYGPGGSPGGMYISPRS